MKSNQMSKLLVFSVFTIFLVNSIDARKYANQYEASNDQDGNYDDQFADQAPPVPHKPVPIKPVPIKPVVPPQPALPIPAEPQKQYITISGKNCKDACDKRGHKYYWCNTKEGSWDYCSKSIDEDYYGKECKAKCGDLKHRKKTYCYLKGGSWNYCGIVLPGQDDYNQNYNDE